jgi:hypothetical protein
MLYCTSVPNAKSASNQNTAFGFTKKKAFAVLDALAGQDWQGCWTTSAPTPKLGVLWTL